jgi:hypothetical protein
MFKEHTRRVSFRLKVTYLSGVSFDEMLIYLLMATSIKAFHDIGQEERF